MTGHAKIIEDTVLKIVHYISQISGLFQKGGFPQWVYNAEKEEVQ